MKKHPPGVIIDQSALKFLKRIIKTHKEGRDLSADTISNQPWVSQLLHDSERSERLNNIITKGQPRINKAIFTPQNRVSGARNLKGNSPGQKTMVFTITTNNINDANCRELRINIAFKVDGKYLTFYYMQ